MATTTLFVLLVSVLLHAAITQPIFKDRKSVLLGITKQVEPTEMLIVLDPDTILSPGEGTEQVKIEGVVFNHALKRTKRGVIEGYHACPEGMVWFEKLNRCITLETFKQIQEDDYDES